MIRFCIILLFCTTISRAVFASPDESLENQNADAVKIESIRNRRGISVAAISAPQEIEIADNLLSQEQRLIFGLVVLNRRQHIFGDDGYAYYMRELLKITGFSADEAKRIINRYKENPQKWLSILQDISKNLTSSGAQNNE